MEGCFKKLYVFLSIDIHTNTIIAHIMSNKNTIELKTAWKRVALNLTIVYILDVPFLIDLERKMTLCLIWNVR